MSNNEPTEDKPWQRPRDRKDPHPLPPKGSTFHPYEPQSEVGKRHARGQTVKASQPRRRNASSGNVSRPSSRAPRGQYTCYQCAFCTYARRKIPEVESHMKKNCLRKQNAGDDQAPTPEKFLVDTKLPAWDWKTAGSPSEKWVKHWMCENPKCHQMFTSEEKFKGHRTRNPCLAPAFWPRWDSDVQFYVYVRKRPDVDLLQDEYTATSEQAAIWRCPNLECPWRFRVTFSIPTGKDEYFQHVYDTNMMCKQVVPDSIKESMKYLVPPGDETDIEDGNDNDDDGDDDDDRGDGGGGGGGDGGPRGPPDPGSGRGPDNGQGGSRGRGGNNSHPGSGHSGGDSIVPKSIPRGMDNIIDHSSGEPGKPEDKDEDKRQGRGDRKAHTQTEARNKSGSRDSKRNSTPRGTNRTQLSVVNEQTEVGKKPERKALGNVDANVQQGSSRATSGQSGAANITQDSGKTNAQTGSAEKAQQVPQNTKDKTEVATAKKADKPKPAATATSTANKTAATTTAKATGAQAAVKKGTKVVKKAAKV